MRFKEILKWLMTHEKYDGKQGTVKTLLVKALGNLEKSGVLKRVKRSHKLVEYSIGAADRARELLNLRMSDFFPYYRRFEEFQKGQTKLTALYSETILEFATILLVVQRAICKALVEHDRSSFIRIGREGREFMIVLWESFAKALDRADNAQVRDFYLEILRGFENDLRVVRHSVNESTVIEPDSWVQKWKADHYSRLKRLEYLKSSLDTCLAEIEKWLGLNRPLTEEQLTKNALEGLEMMKESATRTRSQEQ